jgi:hypothetical protein
MLLILHIERIQLSHQSSIFDVIISVLVGSISASIIAILLSIIASGLQNYSYVMSKSDSNILKQYKDSTKYIVINTMIDDYHDANQKNSLENDKKAKKIKYAQWILFAGILAVIIPLILLFFTSNITHCTTSMS